MENSNFNSKIAIFSFIIILIFVPFYKSKKVVLWLTQREGQKENVFQSAMLSYALFSESLKEKYGLSDFFEKEHLFWLKLKKSPIIFGEKVKEETISLKSESEGVKKSGEIKEEKMEEKRPEEKEKEKEVEKTEKKIELNEQKITPEIIGEEKKEEKEKIEVKEKKEGQFDILIIGDSFMAVYGGLGDPIERKLVSFKNVEVVRLGKVSSGLARPDYFNWELKIAELLVQEKFKIIILMFGLNDAQALTDLKGRVVVNYVKFANKEWEGEYKNRVANLLNTFQENNILVFWIGVPIMRDKNFSEKMRYLNSICIEEIGKYKNAYFIPTWDILAENGEYAAYLTDENGKKRLARVSDGIHLQYFGGNLVVKEVIKKMKEIVKLEE